MKMLYEYKLLFWFWVVQRLRMALLSKALYEICIILSAFCLIGSNNTTEWRHRRVNELSRDRTAAIFMPESECVTSAVIRYAMTAMFGIGTEFDVPAYDPGWSDWGQYPLLSAGIVDATPQKRLDKDNNEEGTIRN